MSKLTKKDKKKTLITIFLISLFILVIVVITSYNFGKKNSDNSKFPIPVVDASKLPSYNGNPRILGQQIYNWTGKIVDKQNTNLTLEVTGRDTNGNELINKIIANINDTTKIMKWDLSNPPENYLNKENKSPISYDDLKVGNDVIVKSYNNLNATNEILATEINLLITP